MLIRLISFLAVLSLASCGGGAAVEAVATPIPVKQTPANLNILVIGQSVSSNCNQFIYGPSANVMQIGKDGNVKTAQDPFEWADCTKGSMWMPLGKRIIEAGLAQKVTFMPIGVGGTKVQDWQPGGSAFAKLNEAIAQIKKNAITFDMVFWHQGSSDFGISRDQYATRLLSVIDYVNNNVHVGRWLIAVHSRCWGVYDAEIEAAQRNVANSAQAGRYLGPNMNILGDEYRIDQCHLNQQGQEEMARMWLEAIKSAGVGK